MFGPDSEEEGTIAVTPALDIDGYAVTPGLDIDGFMDNTPQHPSAPRTPEGAKFTPDANGEDESLQDAPQDKVSAESLLPPGRGGIKEPKKSKKSKKPDSDKVPMEIGDMWKHQLDAALLGCESKEQKIPAEIEKIKDQRRKLKETVIQLKKDLTVNQERKSTVLEALRTYDERKGNAKQQEKAKEKAKQETKKQETAELAALKAMYTDKEATKKHLEGTLLQFQEGCPTYLAIENQLATVEAELKEIAEIPLYANWVIRRDARVAKLAAGRAEKKRKRAELEAAPAEAMHLD